MKQKECWVYVQVLCGSEFMGTQISAIQIYQSPNFQEYKNLVVANHLLAAANIIMFSSF